MWALEGTLENVISVALQTWPEFWELFSGLVQADLWAPLPELPIQGTRFSPAPHSVRLVLLSGDPTLRITALVPDINEEAQVQRDGTICWVHKMDNPSLCWSWACGESMLEHMRIAGYGGKNSALQSDVQTGNETWWRQTSCSSLWGKECQAAKAQRKT